MAQMEGSQLMIFVFWGGTISVLGPFESSVTTEICSHLTLKSLKN